MLRFLPLLCLLAAPAMAADVSSGEVMRLEQAMASLAQRSAWSGVERRYQEMLLLGAPLSRDTLILAAAAAREQGDVLHYLSRLVDAQALEETEDAQSQIDDILTTFGRAQLHGNPGTALTIETMPFRTDAARAVTIAQEQLAAVGRFDGFLPAGSYTFGKTRFKVEPGDRIKRISLVGQRAAKRDFSLDEIAFPKRATIHGNRVELNGAGMRYKYGIAIYAAALYLTVPTEQSQGAVRQDLPKRLTMHMLYERLSKETLTDQFRKSLAPVRGSDRVQPQIDALANYIDTLNRGDKLVFDYIPGEGTAVSIKGEKRGVIEGKEFMWVLFGAFVGDTPLNKPLKAGLLGTK
ncbi:MAG: chalcone isomerase family protein [Myxococcota bacterium]